VRRDRPEARVGRRSVLALAVVSAAFAAGCPKKRDGGGDPSAPVVKDDTPGLLLTWIDAKGEFHVEQSVKEVPLEGRDVVRVVDPDKEEGTHADKIFLADLRNPRADGTYPVRVAPRSELDGIAQARRQSKRLTLASASPSAQPPEPPSTAAQPDPGPAGRPAVIIYGAAWCSACHDAAAYLRRKGVPFIEKDIDEDPAAAREMKAKLAKAGLPRGSIPVIDVKGRVMVGFNPREVDAALGSTM
jgi:glutaredoxin